MKLALKILATVEDDDDDDDGADIIIVLSPRKKVAPGNMSEAPLIDQSMRINPETQTGTVASSATDPKP